MFNQKREMGDVELETLIGDTTTIKGDIRFRGGIHVDGRVEGSIVAEDAGNGLLVISERGFVKGEIKVPEVVVDGEVDGDLHASQRVELREHAKVRGNVHYGTIQMALGAQVNGHLVCEGDAGKTGGNAKAADGKKSAA